MVKVLWFSRHTMTDAQQEALVKKFGEIEIAQVNKTVNSAYELKEEIDAADVVAIVAPINLQQQFLKLADDKPVIIAETKRELVKSEDGTEDKVNFIFNGWTRLVKIEVITESFA